MEPREQIETQKGTLKLFSYLGEKKRKLKGFLVFRKIPHNTYPVFKN